MKTNPNKGCAQALLMGVSGIIMLVGCAVAMFTSSLFVSQVQARQCFDYAAQKSLPDLEHLTFASVVIATNQFRGHICQFTDTRSGAPISLPFDEADIPYGMDTLQVLSMVIPFLCIAGLGSLVWSWVAERTGMQAEWNKQAEAYRQAQAAEAQQKARR